MNQTIYFRKKVWELLADEKDKSALINDLLERHYGGGVIRTQAEEKVKEIAGDRVCPHGYPANGWSCKQGCK